MSYVELNQARLHYQLDGPTDGPVVLLSNSLGTNLSMWQNQLQALTANFRVLRYDTRGHGSSTVTPGPYSIEGLAQDVLGLLDLLHFDRACFCGISMGGMIAQWLGIHAPARLSGLVICNSAAKIGTADTWNQRIETVRAGGMSTIASGVVSRWFTESFIKKSPAAVDAARQLLLATPPAGYIATCEAIRDMDQRESVRRIRTPTLVMAGTHDSVTPPSDSKFLVAQIPGAQYVELNAAHLSSIENAAAFSAALTRFLSQTEAH